MGRNSIDTFPARLRELRERKGMTREELAVAAKTSFHSVAKMEQGTRAPSLELAWRVARALGCTLDDLVQPPAGAAPPEPAKPKRTGKTK